MHNWRFIYQMSILFLFQVVSRCCHRLQFITLIFPLIEAMVVGWTISSSNQSLITQTSNRGRNYQSVTLETVFWMKDSQCERERAKSGYVLIESVDYRLWWTPQNRYIESTITQFEIVAAIRFIHSGESRSSINQTQKSNTAKLNLLNTIKVDKR